MIKQLNSFNRKVYQIGGRVVKILEIPNLGEIEEMIKKIKKYKGLLRGFGIRCIPSEMEISSNFLNSLVKIQPGIDLEDIRSILSRIKIPSNSLIEIQSAGRDLEDILSEVQEQKEFEKLVELLIKTIYPLIKTDFPGVGIDAVPRNFVFFKRVLCYADFFPPKYNENGKFLLEYPDPQEEEVYNAGIFRHYTVPGVLFTILIHLGKLKPEFFEISKEMIIEWYPSLLEIINPIENLFSHPKSLSLEDIRKIPIYPPFVIRYAAVKMGSKKKISKEEITEIFRLTHFQSDPIPNEKLEEALKILGRAV
ncbi:MAG: hypothetical protein ACK413_01740 [Patescibacteria group bacterium]